MNTIREDSRAMKIRLIGWMTVLVTIGVAGCGKPAAPDTTAVGGEAAVVATTSAPPEFVGDKAWNNFWTVRDSGKDLLFAESFAGTPDYPHPGRTAILQLHPKSQQEPCVLSTAIKVGDGPAALAFAASADAAQPAAADFLLKVRIDGRQKYEGVIKAADGWKDVEIDLAPFAGKTVKVEIEIAAGGDSPWAWEFGFIADMRLRACEYAEPAVARTTNWDEWKIVDCGKDVQRLAEFKAEGDFPHPGHTNMLGVHPKDEKTPCIVSRRLEVPASENPRLVFFASSNAAHLGVADCELSVRVDGKELCRKVIAAGATESQTGWQEIQVPLGEYKGKAVNVEIVVAAGGANKWAWEQCYLADLSVL